jgi:hypothetical protein
MMSQVEIDVRSERTTGNGVAKLVVGVMLVAGVAISAMGLQHKRNQAQPSVSWHNVSDTLHQVELAKADLFATLRDKSPQQ